MALMAIAQHHGRPGTPTDQAHVESFFSHLKGDWPLITTIRDPDVLDQTLAHIRTQYNTVRLHAAIGYVTPDDEHHGRGPQIRRARAAGMRRARAERIKQNRVSYSFTHTITRSTGPSSPGSSVTRTSSSRTGSGPPSIRSPVRRIASRCAPRAMKLTSVPPRASSAPK
jgi:hypothetical protein